MRNALGWSGGVCFGCEKEDYILRIPVLLLISGKSGIRIICVAPKEAACAGVRASGSGH